MKSLQILILEDDQSLLQALGEAFKRKGYGVHLAKKPDEAREILAKGSIDWLFVDCLLPQMAGADFAKETRKKFPADRLSVVFMSGIYTDKQFVKESMESCQAVQFLQKPFDLSEALKLVNSGNEPPELSPRQELYGLLARPQVSDRQKRKALERVEQIHGFDLPYIYSLLVDGRMTGYLNIVDEAGSVSGISFCEGAIVGVDVQDKETYLGRLLIEAGYITQAEVDSALSDKTPRKMGQKLIQENLVSPHAFNEILGQQMNIRLSKTIVPQSIRLNFVATEVEDSFPKIEVEDFVIFLHDWVTSKISEGWLENHYRAWGNYSIKAKANLSLDNPLFNTPLLRNTPQLPKLLSGARSLNEIVESADVEKSLLFKALHLLFICGLVGLSERVSEVDQKKKSKRLKTLLEDMSRKNYFEIFELMGGQRGFVGEELVSVYKDFVKILDECPAETDYPEEHKVWQALYTKATEAYELLKDESKRKAYQESLEQGEMERKFVAQRKFDEGHALLRSSQFQKALEVFREVKKLAPEKEGLKHHLIWAKLGLFESSEKPLELLKSVENDLLQIPPEEKHLPLNAFVSGLYNKCQGDLAAAKRDFTRAASMDENLVEARRELHMMNIQTQQKPKDFMKRDLKDLVGALFKKKDSA